jgi:hypothetical protein
VAMEAIDEHLASRISDYQHRRAGESESLGRMQELLSAASPELRTHWQAIIQQTDQQLASRLGLPAASASSAQPAERSTAAPNDTSAHASVFGSEADPVQEFHGVVADNARDQAAANSLLDLFGSNAVTTVGSQFAPATTHEFEDEPRLLPFPKATAQPNGSNIHYAEISRLEQILELEPATIARVLSAAEGDVLLLALAGASPSFMQRFTSMLERNDARALQSRLRRLVSINLQDVDEAQRRLCELASQVVSEAQGGQHQSLLAAHAAA